MIANILIAIGFFGIGSIFGALYITRMFMKCYMKTPEQTILLFEEYKKRWEEINARN